MHPIYCIERVASLQAASCHRIWNSAPGDMSHLGFTFCLLMFYYHPCQKVTRIPAGSRRESWQEPGSCQDLTKIPPMRRYPTEIPTGKNSRHAGIAPRILVGRLPARISPRRQTSPPGFRWGKILATFPGKNLAGNFILAGIPSRKNYWRETLRE